MNEDTSAKAVVFVVIVILFAMFPWLLLFLPLAILGFIKNNED